MLADAKAEADRTDFVITRLFAAPRDLVWKCFTEPERMKTWLGPKGSTMVASTMDLRVGGTYHGAMRDESGRVMWAKFIYREIAAPQRLVWVHSFSDEAGGLTRHPMIPTWPRELLTTVMFEEAEGGKTKLRLRWSPLNATPEEQKTFDATRDGMTAGWSGSFDRMDSYLATTK
ncbi:MAG: SRPBCC domain-containing protein [Xanthobacteraceae bacterium]